ncbi:substrate-binding domain-containing protein [Leifsonia sp. H3M29-4]|uniref:substrate-binding domain-containing protein n=1 Tax=Salinibacterium metalliresistens TaxID=3031321 RepID=UPI0023DB67DD|nr:substrate-binding domain-containing protein [Salinibacterium metalliresistens]MDF1480177.1 substrate-binding domain-containing protein [Salinibacterium metalliresistens]
MSHMPSPTAKRIAAVSVAAAIALGVSGCTTSEPTEPQTGAAIEFDANGRPILDDDYSIQVAAAAGVTVDTTAFVAEPPYDIAAIVQGPTNGWGTTFDAVMNDAFEQSGKVGNLMYVPWDFATENQTKGIEDAIAADVDAILLTSLSRAGLVSAVERATEAGIPVITCMAGVQTDAYTAEVSRDIPLMGFSTADEIATKLDGKGKVVMLHGIAGADAAEFWKSGALAAFSQYPGIEIVSEQYANWSAAEAMDVMRTVIAQEPDVDAVWVGGLEMGPSVIEAFKEAGAELPIIGGTNPTNGFLRLAIENDLEFSVAPFPPGAAQECVNVVLDTLEGKPVAKYTDVIDLMDGVAPYNESEAEKWYEPDFNDDFIGPKVVSDEVYIAAGFGR